MARSFAIFFILALALIPAGALAAPAGSNVGKSAGDLNAQSKRSLGVSIRALAFVFDAAPGTFLLKASLEENGSWKSLKELESAGYVTIAESKTDQGDLVQIALTPKGTQLLHALR